MRTIKTLILNGINGQVVNVEANLYPGLNKFVIVGLADRAILEAKDRITSALLVSKVNFPYGHMVVNLRPAFLEKKGSNLDLPICLAIMMCSQFREVDAKLDMNATAVIGEIGLDGSVRSCKAAPTLVMAAKKLGFKCIILPRANFQETEFISGIKKYYLENISGLAELLLQGEASNPVLGQITSQKIIFGKKRRTELGVEDKKLLVSRDQELRVLMIAAAGRHNVLLDGPPGSGKTTLLGKFNYFLPVLEEEESLEVFQVHSLIGESDHGDFLFPHQRSPHHSISDVALLGGGKDPTPGEISLAHNGVLFLDEVSEFSAYGLESLRQPIIDKKINIARANYKVTFPSDFQFIATRNPCPCGWYKDKTHNCTCTSNQINSYQRKLSGPLMDRIDIKHRVENISSFKRLKEISNTEAEKKFENTLFSVCKARLIQKQRYMKAGLWHKGVKTNASFPHAMNLGLLDISPKARKLFRELFQNNQLSLRSSLKVVLLARTIADLDGLAEISEEHVYEAFMLNNY